MDYIIVFHTHSGAIKFEKMMNRLQIPVSLRPIPRKLSSSCGVCAKITYEGNIGSLIVQEIESIHMEISKYEYRLVYTADVQLKSAHK